MSKQIISFCRLTISPVLAAVDPDVHREEAAENLQAFLVKLDEIEDKVSKVAVPLGYAGGFTPFGCILKCCETSFGMLHREGKLQASLRTGL